jgi:hypothetical protein
MRTLNFHIRMGSRVALAASRTMAVAVAFALKNQDLGFAGVCCAFLTADNLQ